MEPVRHQHRLGPLALRDRLGSEFVCSIGACLRYPDILLYSEIYQITGPIRRMAAFLAGQGYVVGAPEVYHEYEPLGTVLNTWDCQ